MTTEGPIQMASGGADAHEKDSGASFNSSAAIIKIDAHGTASSRYNAGFHFASVDIDGADTIDDVDFELYGPYSGDDLHVNLYADQEDDAVSFAVDADVTSRVAAAEGAGAATVQWNHPNISVGWQSTSDDGLDLNAIYQEIINRGGWASGNDMAALCQGRDDLGYQKFWCVAYDASPSVSAKITFTYTIGGGGPSVLASRRLLSGTGR